MSHRGRINKWQRHTPEQEEAARREQAAKEEVDDPLFGMWRDREDMADVEAYVRKLGVPRH